MSAPAAIFGQSRAPRDVRAGGVPELPFSFGSTIDNVKCGEFEFLRQAKAHLAGNVSTGNPCDIQPCLQYLTWRIIARRHPWKSIHPLGSVLRFQDFAPKLLSLNILFEIPRQLCDFNRSRAGSYQSVISRTSPTFVLAPIPPRIFLVQNAQGRFLQSSISKK
jgi:hypothetical protein